MAIEKHDGANRISQKFILTGEKEGIKHPPLFCERKKTDHEKDGVGWLDTNRRGHSMLTKDLLVVTREESLRTARGNDKSAPRGSNH